MTRGRRRPLLLLLLPARIHSITFLRPPSLLTEAEASSHLHDCHMAPMNLRTSPARHSGLGSCLGAFALSPPAAYESFPGVLEGCPSPSGLGVTSPRGSL